MVEHIARLQEVLAAALEDPARPQTERRKVTEPGLVGRVAAVDVDASAPLPGFDNAQMDGFAVRSHHVEQLLSEHTEITVPLAGVIPAGSPAGELPDGATIAVMTGAPIPEGADCVIPVERTSTGSFDDLPYTGQPVEITGEGHSVTFTSLERADVRPGTYVRVQGSDVAAGDRILKAGDTLTPAALGLLAATGLPDVLVRPRVRALVLATGDEVRQPGSILHPGQIHDANTALLTAGLESLGITVEAASVAADHVEEFSDMVDALLADHQPQLVVTAGGVSAGAYEVVRQALQRRGVSFGSVAQQPGGPQGWGMFPSQGRRAAVAIVCLPGNPVSCAVSVEALLRPALAGLDAGCPPQHRVRARLEETLDSPEGLTQYRRVVFTGGPDEDGVLDVRAVGGPSSHLLGHLARADALLELPEEDTHVDVGEVRDALLLTGRALPV